MGLSATAAMARRSFPKFRTDREAAGFWDAHDSTPYVEDLPQARVKVAAGLRRRVVARAKARQAVVLRLEPRQIAAVKRLAVRRRIPYQTLLRSWISEGIARAKTG